MIQKFEIIISGFNKCPIVIIKFLWIIVNINWEDFSIIFFTEIDLLALQEIWGIELSNSNKAKNKIKIEKKSIKNISLFEKAYKKGKNGKHFEAISIYTKILEKDPNHINALRNRGKSKEILGNLESACSDWLKALRLGDIHMRYLIKKKC